MKRISMASVVFSVVALAGCGSMSDASSFEAGGGGGDRNAGTPTAGSSSSGGTSGGGLAPSEPGDGEKAGGTTTGTPGAQAGQLTAGVWDDNLNFNFFSKYIELSGSLGGLPLFTQVERTAAQQKWLQRAGSNELDIAFLVDTTGSMGDELSYLQAEIDNIATTIKAKFPATTPRYGLVLYKDHGDAYLTRWFDFKSLEEFRTKLSEQTVGGGGDYPEAVPEGLDQVVKLGWRTGAVSRMAFWVADAPHHVGHEAQVRAAIDTAVLKDVHLYPVAASGTDPRAEFTMRTAAQITGGRYVFLTDDSGIGGEHAEPHIPCYHVTKFNGAVVRMVESEMKGVHVAPAAEEIIRTVGNPTNGQCTTKSQGNVLIY